jgi:probable addiction module antidote protein
MKAKGK